MRTPKLNNFLVNQRQASPLTERNQKALGVKASPFRPLTPADSYRHFIKQKVNPVIGDHAPAVKMNGGGEMVGTKDNKTPIHYADGGMAPDDGSASGGVRGVISEESAADQAKKSLADSMNNPNANAMNNLKALWNNIVGPAPSPSPKGYANGGVAEYGVNDRDLLHTSLSGGQIHAAHGAVIEAEPDDEDGMTIHARKMTPKEEDQTKDAAIAALKHMLGSLESSDQDSDEDEERPSKGKKK
jgi:hypothetical protein